MKKVTKMTEKVIKAAAKSDVVALKGYDPDIGIFYALHKVVRGKDVFVIDNERGPLLYAYQKGQYIESVVKQFETSSGDNAPDYKDNLFFEPKGK